MTQKREFLRRYQVLCQEFGFAVGQCQCGSMALVFAPNAAEDNEFKGYMNDLSSHSIVIPCTKKDFEDLEDEDFLMFPDFKELGEDWGQGGA